MWFLICILFIIAGVVLTNNAMWFAGAATVGAICFWAGIIGLAVVILIIILAIIASL